MEIKVIDNKTVTVDGTAYSWRIRPDGSIKVSSGLGSSRKLVKDFIEKHIGQRNAAGAAASADAQPVAPVQATVVAAANMAPPPAATNTNLLDFTAVEVTFREIVLTDEQTKAFTAVVKNIMDNSGGAFGWVDQAKPLNTSEEAWDKQVDELVQIGVLHRLTNSRNDVLFTGKGTHMALKLALINHKNYAHIVINDLAYIPA